MLFRSLALVFLLCQLCAQGVISDNTEDVTTTDNPTTTEKPDTTTPKPTTTTPTTAKPTEKPTTAPPKPTPTPMPKPPPAFPSNIGNWSVSDAGKNVTCIVLTGALQLDILLADNKTHAKVDVPEDASAKGNCDELSQTITLTWYQNNAETESRLTFQFVMNKAAAQGGIGAPMPISPNNYALKDVTGLAYYLTINKTMEYDNFTLEDVYAYQTMQNHSYRCMSEESLKSKDGMVHLKLAHLQMQAFHDSKDSKFGTVTTCTLDGYVADIVPIAVGASLAGLVAIVLVAYLIGRRRSRARGYQSV